MTNKSHNHRPLFSCETFSFFFFARWRQRHPQDTPLFKFGFRKKSKTTNRKWALFSPFFCSLALRFSFLIFCAQCFRYRLFSVGSLRCVFFSFNFSTNKTMRPIHSNDLLRLLLVQLDSFHQIQLKKWIFVHGVFRVRTHGACVSTHRHCHAQSIRAYNRRQPNAHSVR